MSCAASALRSSRLRSAHKLLPEEMATVQAAEFNIRLADVYTRLGELEKADSLRTQSTASLESMMAVIERTNVAASSQVRRSSRSFRALSGPR